MSKNVDDILKEASDHVQNELSHQEVPKQYQDTFIHARMSRYIRLAENEVAKEYYKVNRGHINNSENDSISTLLTARIFIFIISAMLANLVLYFPVYFIAKWWGEVNSHDATYIAIIINTAVGMISFGIWSEFKANSQSFVAGMRAEADEQIVINYHKAKNKLNNLRVSKGHLPDDDDDWG